MNGIIVIDKPAGWTSHDVVGKLRGILRERRIGHSGTLDPMATGVLPVFVGRATRAVEFCEADEKEYVAEMRFGLQTDTQDTTGTVLAQCTAQVTKEQLEEVLAGFRGCISQIPPMYSAIKVQGRKLYELARRGMEVERPPRQVEIRRLEVLDAQPDGCRVRVVCSKGTYIRTLCGDIGAALGCGAAMSSLRRIRAGRFTVEDAVTIEEAAAEGERLLRPVDALFGAYPACRLSGAQEKKCRCGSDFLLPEAENGLYRVYGPDGAFLMLGRQTDGVMHTVKSFFEV